MMKYRIKPIIENDEVKFVIQKGFWFYWQYYNMIDYYGSELRFARTFKSISAAKQKIETLMHDSKNYTKNGCIYME